MVAHFADADKWHSKTCVPASEECNNYDLCPVSLIGQGGLLLVVS